MQFSSQLITKVIEIINSNYRGICLLDISGFCRSSTKYKRSSDVNAWPMKKDWFFQDWHRIERLESILLVSRVNPTSNNTGVLEDDNSSIIITKHEKSRISKKNIPSIKKSSLLSEISYISSFI